MGEARILVAARLTSVHSLIAGPVRLQLIYALAIVNDLS